MDIQTSIRTCLMEKYADFTGRAQRSEFWWYVLAVTIIGMVLSRLDQSLFGMSAFGTPVGILSPLFSLAVLIPNIAVGARRLHDIGRSGWWMLIALIPLVGILVLIYWYAQPGTAGDNEYGADPLRDQ